jgi:hypothetical protein
MIGKWLGMGLPCGIALLLIVGVAKAGASNPARVLKFYDTAGVDTLVGSPSGKPTIGGEDILTLRRQNVGAQFGSQRERRSAAPS